MARSFNLLVLLVAFTVAHVSSSVVREEQIARLLPEGRAAATVFVTSTVTASGSTVVTIPTKLVCAVLTGAATTNTCRRKRQFWASPIILYGQPDNEFQQYQPFNPTQVLNVEPSVLPEYRNRPAPYFRPFAPAFPSPFAIQSSFEKPAPVSVRVADPFFGANRYSAFSSLFSNIISSILTPPVTSTNVKTVYTSTVTSFSYTTVNKYTVDAGASGCVPAGLVTCTA